MMFRVGIIKKINVNIREIIIEMMKLVMKKIIKKMMN